MENEEEGEIGIKLKERGIKKQQVETLMKWRRNRMKADAGKMTKGVRSKGKKRGGCKQLQYRCSEFLYLMR
jgi:hypothetical protein